MSAVYRAFDTVMGREVAIKRLLPVEETRLNEADVAAISREAAALARLQHPNVITIYALEEDAEGPFFVMELVTGQDLHEIIREGALSWPDFRDVAPQCLDPLVVAGEMNLLHRDIKPGNLMLTRTGSGRFVVKLLDFGLAKFSQQPSLQTLDQSGSFLGSIDYIAPEQLELQPLDQRTDLYSLGCVYYYMLTQSSPFTGENPAVTSMNHLRHRCRSIGEIRPDLPPEVADWIMRMISREPEDRPANAFEALRQWNDALFGRPFPPVAERVETDAPFLADPGPPIATPVVRVLQTGPMPPSAASKARQVRSGGAPGRLALPPRGLPAKPAPPRGLLPRLRSFWNALPPTGKWIALASVAIVLLVESLRSLHLFDRAEPKAATGLVTEPGPIKEPLPLLPLPSQFTIPAGEALPPLPVRDGIFAWFSAAKGVLGRDYLSPAEPGGQVAAWINLADPRPVRSLLRDPGDPVGRFLPSLVFRDPSLVLGLKGVHPALTTTNRSHLVSPRGTETFESGATLFFVGRIEAGEDRPYRIQAAVWDGRYMGLGTGLDARVSAISKGRADGPESRVTIAWPGGELGIFVHRWDPKGGKQSLTGIAATSPNRPFLAESSLEFGGPPLSQFGFGRRGFNDKTEARTGNVTFEIVAFNRVLADEEVERMTRYFEDRYFSWQR